MRTYKNRNDVPDDKTELVNKDDMIERLERIRISSIGEVAILVGEMLRDLKK